MIINTTNVYRTLPLSHVRRNIPAAHGSAPRSPKPDPVEFPRFRRLTSPVPESSAFRMARVQAIRAEIENGTYETAERISGTVERLLDVIV
jgi:hypothetical protein